MSGSTMTRFAEALEPRRLLTSIVPVSGGGYLVGYAGWTDATRGVDLFVERFDATGRPDKSFGGTPDGIAKLDFGAAETFSDLAVLPDGTIAVLGSDSFQSDAAYFAHLDADGKGLSYLGQHTFPEGSAALAVTDGGRVYLGGRSLHVRRLAKDRPPDSQLPPFSPAPPTDPTFGLAGVFDPLLPVGRTMPFNYVAGVTAVADGGVLAALAPNDYPRNPGVLKLTAGGQPDVTFGVGGIARLPVADERLAVMPATVVPLPGGGYLVGGSRYENHIDRRYYLAKLRSAGTLDPTFGAGGIVETDFGPPGAAGIYGIDDLILQPDGKFVTAGSWLMRYNPDGTVDETFAANRLPGGSIAAGPDGRLVLPRFTQNDGENAVPHLIAYRADGTRDLTFGKPVPDVLVRSVTVPSSNAVAGTKWGTVRVTLANAGRVKAAGLATLTLALATDGQPGGGTTVLTKAIKVSIAINGKMVLKVKVALPAHAPSGPSKLVATLTANRGPLAEDAADGNNTAVSAATVLVEQPRTDLRNAWNRSLPVTAKPGKSIRLKALVTNDGNVPYVGRVAARAVLVNEATGVSVDLVAKPVKLLAPINPGGARRLAMRFSLPAGLPAGVYRFQLVLDVLGDADLSDNLVEGRRPLTVRRAMP